MLSTFSCPDLKNYLCSDIIGLAINKGLVKIPLKYKTIPLMKKNKCGARPKAPKAIKRQKLI